LRSFRLKWPVGERLPADAKTNEWITRPRPQTKLARADAAGGLMPVRRRPRDLGRGLPILTALHTIRAFGDMAESRRGNDVTFHLVEISVA
jgi:hypothetical protein